MAVGKKTDYAIRDREGKVTLYVLLWKKRAIALELFENYWKDVYGPVCARLPGQYQYWQFNLAHNEGGVWPPLGGLVGASAPEEQLDGIAELTFKSEADRAKWFSAAKILIDDQQNIFRKAIGYKTLPGNSITYVDYIENGAPNGSPVLEKYHCLIRKADGVSLEEFRRYCQEKFAPTLAENEKVLKLRLHLLEPLDNSRPNAGGVDRYEPPELQYQAALEIAVANRLDLELMLASQEYQEAVKYHHKYVKAVKPFPERSAYTLVYDGKMTLAGDRGAKVADLIMKVGAENQLREDIKSLILHGVPAKGGPSGLGHLLQGVQHIGITTDNMERSLEFYTEVLGGKVVVGESNMTGDGIQNTLFQKEELEAIARGVNPKSLGVPNLRDGQEALDVKFISFGNTVVELLYIKDPVTGKIPSWMGRTPAHIYNVNAMHLSFHVKEDMDLNLFAQMLEAECQRRGMTNVICNRIINVKSEAERRAADLNYCSTKFWPDRANGDSAEQDFGEFEGWALFYCKGPSGEQLEFNQVTRNVKKLFQKGVQEYNRATGTTFVFPVAKIPPGTMAAVEQHPGPIAAAPVAKGNSAMSEKFPGQNTDMVKRLFSRGEAFDAEGFITFFTDTPVYQFGNFEVCFDKESIKKSANNFFSQINAVYHEIKMMWEQTDVVFVEMDVIYWRKDGSVVSLPCCDIFRVEGEKFSELRIFMDVNPVFDPSIPVPKSASVLTVSQGQNMIPPGTMRRHFAEHPEAKQRIAQGYVPKWSIAGPKWPINLPTEENSQAQAQLQMVGELAQAVGEQNWEKVKFYLTDDVLYKVGSTEPRYGPQQVVDFFVDTFTNTAVFTGHRVRKVWQEPDVITIEMDAYYQLVPSKQKVTIACCDIYRLRGNKVSEWRVYADMSPWG